MEEIIEIVTRGVTAALRFIIFAVFINFIFFNIGRVFLLIITCGKYPRGTQIESVSERIWLTGVSVAAIVWGVLALYNNGKIL